MKSVYQQQGNTITVGRDGSYRSYMSSKFKVILPDEFNVEVGTSGGDIAVSDLKGDVELKTSGGDIMLKDIKGFIEASTSGGDVKAEMTLTNFSQDHHITLKSSGGDIVLYIPPKLPATIDATINVTGFSRKEYTISSDFPLNVERKNDEGGWRRKRAEIIYGQGKINGGGDLIKLITSNGNIEINKLR